MSYALFDVFAVIITLTAVFSFVNYRFLRLPTAIGVMVISMTASGPLGPGRRGAPGLSRKRDPIALPGQPLAPARSRARRSPGRSVRV